MTTKPIPVLLCGKFPSHTKATSEILQPEFQGILVSRFPFSLPSKFTKLT